jgi:hypothetical protein
MAPFCDMWLIKKIKNKKYIIYNKKLKITKNKKFMLSVFAQWFTPSSLHSLKAISSRYRGLCGQDPPQL